MKKPQALIGLLAALGTAIGVLVAIVGLPYGRMNYSAFAEVYHNGTNTTGLVAMVIDCDVTDVTTQTDCTYDPSALPAGMQVDITLGNETGIDFIVSAFAIYVNNPDSTKFGHVYKLAGPTGYDGNPDYNGVNPGTDPTDTTAPPDVVGSFACGSPAPGDVGGSPATINKSSLLCNNGSGDGPTIVSGAPHLVLGRLSYSFADTCTDPTCAPGVTPSTAVNGDNVPLTLTDMVVFDDSFSEVGSCNPVVSTAGFCGDATIHFLVPPTNTPAPPTDTPTPGPTNTPTDTPTNTATATNTFTPTATFTPVPPPAGAGLIKVPESCGIDAVTLNITAQDADNCVPNAGGAGFNAANLWLCNGACAGPGEGNLIVFEYGINIQSDYDNDNVADVGDNQICTNFGADGIANTADDSGCIGSNTELGLGAYEFQTEYDNNVIQSVNPCDVVFSATSADANNPGGADGILDPAGAARGNVDEINGLNNPYCTPDAGGANNGTCTFSSVLENLVRFGCVTNGQAQGPAGNFDVAALNLIPHPDLNNDIFPGNNNGVITVLKDNGCETADRLGHPTLGDVNGGLNQICTDLAVTVRILEGDLNLDCSVDVTDAQNIATHYGGFFGSLLYSKWLDLEPATHDLDIDIKDLQKVFGRIGSNCQDPIPAQLPAGFPAVPGN